MYTRTPGRLHLHVIPAVTHRKGKYLEMQFLRLCIQEEFHGVAGFARIGIQYMIIHVILYNVIPNDIPIAISAGAGLMAQCLERPTEKRFQCCQMYDNTIIVR